MKILNINKLQNQQKNITQSLLQEFAEKSSKTFISSIKQAYEERNHLNQVIIKYEPIINKIYAEVLGFKMQQMKDFIDNSDTNNREQIVTLIIHIEDVLQEIEKHFAIPYDKKYIEEVCKMLYQFVLVYEITIPEVVQVEGDQNSSCRWCQKCTIS
ncbi:unnamed protein product (macronuclear) [Paramecium tetraurelia]|uniref:Uncharacterized protein n=1 Tax=Paramecium tetraurelia TaxID=5888 RepID=A0CWJ2_PARTE|nr:uncharacterized protein GSPATT00001362001 [Paramecium tetraurelia]CAK75159.1 unnamed protein product [Paramecium tetraurelia]|eukprot:XP_001442556.1 hypothetical protein (macronuclear) [Paramecium tetraurelia strain d4-2]